MDRLTKIFNCIKPSTAVADIGCDHGNLEAMLIRQNRADKVIATDISEKSLAKAVALCRTLGIVDRVGFRLGDGLSVLCPGEADTIVIAGMGGILISNILKNNMETARTAELVLCPHSHEGKLRKFLFLNGYQISNECLALEDGRYYQIICAAYIEKSECPKDDFYYEISAKLLEGGDEHLVGFLEYKLRITRGIIQDAEKSRRKKAQKIVLELSRFAERLEECIDACKHETN